ncbi:MAG: hypothetical protein IBJ18_05095 [Phycisphaerales bacterium]|nr:hypothetical protein [Phycisphaerales bacterium]
MSRLFRSSCVLGLSLLSLAGTAHALPALMDRVPADAFVSVVVSNPQRLEQRLKTTAQAMGLPPEQIAQINLEALLQMAGIADSVKADGGLAFFTPLPKEEKNGAGGSSDDLGIVLIPVKDYAGFVKAMGGTGTAAQEKTNLNGEDMFVRNLGEGYAAMAKNEAALSAFSGKGGNLSSHRKLISAGADKISESADVVIMINAELGRPLIKKAVAAAQERMQQQMMMMGQGAQNTEAAQWAVNLLVDNSRSLLMGLSLDGSGVSADAVTTFTEGSKLAKITSGKGLAGALLGKLPKREYLLAGALDLSNADLKNLLAEMPIPADQKPQGFDMMAMMKNTDGAGFVLGFNPGGIMAGALTQTVSYVAVKDTDAGLKTFQDSIAALQANKMGKGKYTPAKAEVDGVKVDEYEMQIKAPEGQPGAGQAMIMMFGPSGGPTGYIAKSQGGYIQTYSKSSELMSAALKASKGENTLSGDPSVKPVTDRLPANRLAELYISPRGIIETIKPLAAMVGGAGIDFDTPAQVAPIAFSIAPSEGSAIATIYVPNQSVKTITDFATAAKKALNPEEEPEAEPAPAKKDEGKKDAKPKF